ncbi:precorrin-6A/cobalt-precorrin-6A reductase [Kushneria avicenniae]|uniref:Precorrin-6A/cobalt-precorrin-6A reductase n=1 Tax=Kushneria avicenniae TaxID=402385 RepID=A0A1I1LWA9_9GAMM|nr:cobalt-precorrin-6A reductase [Kushneria avicenniae]SFC74613.1 precorrin-6A/cobalt-precorrin-6A reductase [Kushneria avicenniae]
MSLPASSRHRRLLLLGGTLEARRIAPQLAALPRVSVTLSLAGRTRVPINNGVATRIGGFGGVTGLVAWLSAHRIDGIIVATHPFAAQMAHNAHEAARRTGLPIVRVARPGWQRQSGDRWFECDSTDQAVTLLGETPRRVLLTFGRAQAARFEAAPQHHYVVRSIDPIDPPLALPHVDNLIARGPFTLAQERHLLRSRAIDVLVTKHSGGEATRAKLDAARALGIDVIMIRRPVMPDTPVVDRLETTGMAALLDWVSAL